MLQIDNPPTAAIGPADEAAFAAACRTVVPGLGAQSQPIAGIAQGKLTEGRHTGKTIYPGVARGYSVYVSAQYDPATPLRLLVVQDRWLYLKPTINPTLVLDNLIAAGDIRPLVAVFIEPGDLPGAAPDTRGNRSFEYDSVSDAYARFLLDELLPEALTGLNVSTDPAERAICGMSSGGICAFNAAWHRPDAFGKVISHCGSFTDIRGGNVYPALVRKNGRKPIRVFLQSGATDFDNGAGSWAVANHDMAAAFRFAGYDYRFEFGLGGHNLDQAAAILPQTLRWIWR